MLGSGRSSIRSISAANSNEDLTCATRADTAVKPVQEGYQTQMSSMYKQLTQEEKTELEEEARLGGFASVADDLEAELALERSAELKRSNNSDLPRAGRKEKLRALRSTLDAFVRHTFLRELL